MSVWLWCKRKVTIVYRSGKENAAADAFSRAPQGTSTDSPHVASLSSDSVTNLLQREPLQVQDNPHSFTERHQEDQFIRGPGRPPKWVHNLLAGSDSQDRTTTQPPDREEAEEQTPPEDSASVGQDTPEPQDSPEPSQSQEPD